ncbi:MAG: CapA family protein [Bacteroidetes bacterium]|nr:MAG: CapA family protein [Bacteroidota bacterium]
MAFYLRRFIPQCFISVLLFLFIAPVLRLSAQTDTLRLLFAGDVMGHDPQIKSALQPDGTYDYRPCFTYVKPIIEAADLAVANLEVTLPGKAPYSGYPMFKSPDALAVALRDAGFDIIVTANNHSNDSRAPGLLHTIETIRDLGMQQTGTFKDPRDRDLFYPLMVYRNGFKLAILNYTYGTNGVRTQSPTIVNLIDKEQMARDLAEARARKPHFIIAIMHWGLEYQLQENAEQRDLAQFLIRNGADMVIGSHPHVVQPVKIETVTMPDGSAKSALVVYSLGNFISNQRKTNTDGGIMFQVELLHRKGIPYAELGKYQHIPVWRYIHREASGKVTYYALPVSRSPENLTLPTVAKTAMRQFAGHVRQQLPAVSERK